jgi:hypothetical protein
VLSVKSNEEDSSKEANRTRDRGGLRHYAAGRV